MSLDEALKCLRENIHPREKIFHFKGKKEGKNKC